jgi:hypothetical protein
VCPIATTLSDVDLVYFDVRDALRALDEARASPKEVRRALSRFMELSQRLTSAMRKDFSKLTGEKWNASAFAEWSPATELIKYFRNEDQHGEQVFITVLDRHFYKIPDNVEIRGFPDREFTAESRWHMTDQMRDHPPEGIELRLSGSASAKDSGEVLLPERTESVYVFYPRSAAQERRIARAGLSDVHEFARESFATLTKYYLHYNEEVVRKRRDKHVDRGFS